MQAVFSLTSYLFLTALKKSMVLFLCVPETHGPDSVMVRAFASEVGGAGSNPGCVIPDTLIMVPVATLLGAQH